MVLFVVGNTLSAVATGYGMLLAGRVVAALAHGAFFGIGSVLAASLVPADRKAGAISIMFGGLTLANVLGVPLGTFVGQQWGWRATFALIAVVGVVAAAGIAALVPDAAETSPGGSGESGDELRPSDAPPPCAPSSPRSATVRSGSRWP